MSTHFSVLGRSLPITIASATGKSELQYPVVSTREKDEPLTLAIRRYPRPVNATRRGVESRLGGGRGIGVENDDWRIIEAKEEWERSKIDVSRIR